MELRGYQEELITRVYGELGEGRRRVCMVLPCGGGKTVIAGSMIENALEVGLGRCMYITHRHELIEQTARTFELFGLKAQIVEGAKAYDEGAQVLIASVQTLVRRLESIPEPGLIIIDECHHVLANTYLRIVNAYKGAILIGITATPIRMNGVTLSEVFESQIEGATVSELIKLGYLSKFRYYSMPPPEGLNKLGTRFGDYDERDIAQVMSNPQVVVNVVENYERLASGKSAICYCVNIAHSITLAKKFKERGIRAAHCDGSMDKETRADIVQRFREGEIQVLCNAELFGEGFDVPHMDAVLLTRPTMSMSLHIQQSMRCMRVDPQKPDKEALILDFVGNYQKFGTPECSHQWNMEGETETKECPGCYMVVNEKTLECPNCGYVFAKKEVESEHPPVVRRLYDGKEQIKSELEEIEKDNRPYILRKLENLIEVAKMHKFKLYWAVSHAMQKCRTYDDYVIIAERMGYKKGWAWHKWQERNQEVLL